MVSDPQVLRGRKQTTRGNPRTHLRTAMLFATAFGFFYMEPFPLGSTNFASAWKVVAFSVVLGWMVTDRRYRSASMPAVLGAAYALVACLNPSLLVDPVGTISYALKALYIPAIVVIVNGWRRSKGVTPEALLRFARSISVFTSMSTLPFLANVLEPISSGGYDLSLFGVEGSGFAGIFFSSHGAAISLSFAAVILAHSAKHARSIWTAGFYAALLLISLYCVYITYARTGYVLVAMGLIIIFGLPLRFWKVIFLAPLAGLALIFVAESMVENEVLMMRLSGENVYTLARGGTGDVTSGRFRFWAAAVDSYWEGSPVELLTGVGEHKGKELIGERVRLQVSSHNEFVDSLLFAGFVGLLLFVLFMFHLMRMALYAGKDKTAGNLALALFAIYSLQMVLQGERVLLPELMMVLVLVSGVLSVNRKRMANTQPVRPGPSVGAALPEYDRLPPSAMTKANRDCAWPPDLQGSESLACRI